MSNSLGKWEKNLAQFTHLTWCSPPDGILNKTIAHVSVGIVYIFTFIVIKNSQNCQTTKSFPECDRLTAVEICSGYNNSHEIKWMNVAWFNV